MLPGTLVDLMGTGVLAWGLAMATSWVVDAPASYVAAVFVLLGIMAVPILRHASEALPSRRLPRTPGESLRTGLGPANRVTLLRAALVVAVAGLVLRPPTLDDSAYWWVILLSAMALVLDGVDGRVARRTETSTAFGARFDMELDAFLMLTLSLLVWMGGRLGPWVIAIGALRYLFVAAAIVVPSLRRELPPSQRRKTVCVVQGVALLVCLGPIVPSQLAAGAAAAALALLVYSFGVDVWWLLSPRIASR